MSKNIKLFALMFLISFAGFAQVGIGTTTPDASAALDITASDKGFLMPRMTTVQKDAIATPAVGLQVYDTDTNSVWTYNGTVWKEGSGGAGGVGRCRWHRGWRRKRRERRRWGVGCRCRAR